MAEPFSSGSLVTLAPDAASEPTFDPALILQAFAQYQWKLVVLLLVSLAIGLVIRLLKTDTWLPTIPKAWRTLTAWTLGLVAGVLAHVTAGVPWDQAIAGGVAAAFGAIFGHVTLIEGLRGGTEIPLPKWLRKSPGTIAKEYILSEFKKEDDTVPPTDRGAS